MDCTIHQVPAECDSNFPLPGDLVFSGSFNPLHRGHLIMAKIAKFRSNRCVWFEISKTNAEKGAIEIRELESRLKQDFGEYGLIVSNSASFSEKSTLFPEACFIVGADTILRIADLDYYNGRVSEYRSAISKISSNGCRFVVFPRKIANKLITGQNIALDDQILDLCSFVDPDDFQDDISSTKIREQQ